MSSQGEWHQTMYVKATSPDVSDFFGAALALSADGKTLAVGAQFEQSAATGINGEMNDNSAPETGAVYVY